jgi:hypothetical protein
MKKVLNYASHIFCYFIIIHFGIFFWNHTLINFFYLSLFLMVWKVFFYFSNSGINHYLLFIINFHRESSYLYFPNLNWFLLLHWCLYLYLLINLQIYCHNLINLIINLYFLFQIFHPLNLYSLTIFVYC